MNVTQTALTIKSLAAHMSLADAVERTVPGADPAFWRKQVANLGKPPRKSTARTPRTGKTRQAAKQAAAMAALVARVNEQPEAPRVVARIASAGGFTAELLDDGTVRYV